MTVDGQERTPQKLFGAFLGIELEPGSHVIELSYMPEGLKEGIFISLFCASVLAAAAFAAGRKRQKERRAMHRRLSERRARREEELSKEAFGKQQENEAAGKKEIRDTAETEKDINQET